MALDLEKKGTCSISFKEGQKWLYSGQSSYDKTVLLEDKNIKINEIRINKDLPYKNKYWNKCESSNQCKVVGYACSLATVNNKYSENLDRLINETGLNPATINCFAPVRQPFIKKPLCIKNECSLLDVKEYKK